jgi:hypothetical protein
MAAKETNMKLFILLISVIFLSGCASMFNGSQQLVTIKTDKNTEIFIDGRYAGKGYSKRKLARDETHIIRLESGTCTQSITTQARFNKMSLLGFIVDLGLVSIPVDFISGAAWNIYPNKINMTAQCIKPAQG